MNGIASRNGDSREGRLSYEQWKRDACEACGRERGITEPQTLLASLYQNKKMRKNLIRIKDSVDDHAGRRIMLCTAARVSSECKSSRLPG